MRPESREQIVLRLRSAAGHLWAVATMLEAGEDRRKVLVQVSAVQAAVGAARKAMIEGFVAECSEAIRHEPCADLRASELAKLMEGLQQTLGKSGWKGVGFK